MSISYGEKPSLLESFHVQRAVVGALFMRELHTRFGRHNIGFLWLFLEPLTLGTAVGMLHSLSGHDMPGGIDPFLFSMFGYVPFFVFRSVVTRAPSAIHSNLTLLYHQRVTLLDIMLARNILESSAILGVIVVIVAVCSFVAEKPPANPGLLLLGVSCMILLSHGLSLLLASAGGCWEGFDRLVHPVTYLLMPVSGAFFALNWFSPEWREILLWMPLINIHEMIRDGQFGDQLPSYYDTVYILEWIVGSNVTGMLALRAVRSKLSMY